MIKKIAALFLVCFSLGATLAACDSAPDVDDAEVEIEDGAVEVDD